MIVKRTDFTDFPTLIGDSGHDHSDLPMTSIMADMYKGACEKGMMLKVCLPSKACMPDKDCPKRSFKLAPSADCSGGYVRNTLPLSRDLLKNYF